MANKLRSSLDRGLDVLELLASPRADFTLTAIAEALGMSKSGVHSLLRVLVRRSFVSKTSHGTYELGFKVWEVGGSAPGAELATIAAPHMALLAEKTGEGAILGRLDGADVVYLHLAEGSQPVRVHAAVGDRIPAHCTSTGLALLASLSDDEVLSRLPAKLLAITEATITSKEQLLRELELIRRRGHAVNRGGWRIDVGGIATLIRDTGGTTLGALCVAVPRYRMTKVWSARVLLALKQAADQIGRAASLSPRSAASHFQIRSRA